MIFDKVFGGDNYSIFLMKSRDGGTDITVRRAQSAYDIVAADAENVIRGGTQGRSEPPKFPSWARHGSTKDFVHSVLSAAYDKGVPMSYLELALESEDTTEIFWSYAATIEFEGGSLDQQKQGVIDLLHQGWCQLDDVQKASMIKRDEKRLKEL